MSATVVPTTREVFTPCSTRPEDVAAEVVGAQRVVARWRVEHARGDRLGLHGEQQDRSRGRDGDGDERVQREPRGPVASEDTPEVVHSPQALAGSQRGRGRSAQA